MATQDELYAALRNADAAGDTAGAQRLADYIRSQGAATPVAPAAPNPTDGSSFGQNMLEGVGGAMADLGLRAKQVYAGVADAVAPRPQTLSSLVSGQKPMSRSDEVTAEIDAKRKLDAPLMATVGGKVGTIATKAAPALAAAFVPGGQGLAASIGSGVITGLLDPVGTGESSLQNAALGGAGGLLGFGAGKAVGYGADKLINRAAASQTANAGRDAAAVAARDAGYVIPPTQSNPTMLNKALEGFSGKISTGQKASLKNQVVTNQAAAKSLGLPADQPITREVLGQVRQQAGQAYQAVENAGVITPGQAYSDALDGITKPYLQASQSFPSAKVSPVVAEIDALRTPQFDAASAVAKIRGLRADADTAFAQGDKDAGKALKSGAQALEDAIDSHLTTTGAPADLLKNFRGARQLIAKTYSVEKALNDSTGNVAAGKLAQQLARGKPLSGELKTIAQAGQSFPKAMQEINSSIPGVSPLDFFGASSIGAASGNPLSLLAVGARPVVRSTILSQPYQAMMSTPKYAGSGLLNLIDNQAGRIGLLATGDQLPQFAK